MNRITISKGQLTIGTNGYGTGGYAAIAEGTRIAIVHKNNTKDRIFDSEVNQVRLNNVLYSSTALFCIVFNSLCAGALDGDVAGILENTDYTDTPFSSLETPVAETHVCNHAKKGYFILSAPEDNVGLINYGPTGVGAASAGLAAGQSVVIESGDLSKWFVKNVTATDKVNIAGEYKN